MPLLAGAGDSLPKDVERFVQRRDACDHLRGEAESPPVIQQANKACKGTDRQLQRLKSKYRLQPHINRLLNEYEPRIEAR